MRFPKIIYLLFVLLAASWMSPVAYSQEGGREVDSLIIRLKDAGREWNTYADQLIAIGESAVVPLIEVLQDTSLSQWTRRIAAMTLNDMHSPTYIEPALQLLLDRNEDPVLRNQVTNGLKGHDLSYACDELWRVYQEESGEFFRLNIAAILRTSDPSLAFQAYEQLYLGTEGYCKQQSLKYLVDLRPQQATEFYLTALQTDDWMTANLAIDSLKSVSQIPSGRIMRMYNRADTPEIVRWRIIHVMGNRPEGNHLDLFMDAFTDPSWLVNNEATLMLARMPADRVLPEMRFMEHSDDPDLVRRAGWVIGQFEREPSQELASMQPYNGYPMIDNIEDIKELLKDKCVDTISFRRGDVVADIGAGNGYIEAMLSIFHDDLTFYIQDINPNVCNPNNVREVVDFYQEVNGRPFTNNFIAVNGTDTDTNLPDQYFDKVLMLWTYQYLKKPREFIMDLRRNMKNDGLLYVINPDEDFEYGKLLSIEFGWNGATIDRQITDIIECGFELVGMARNYDSDDMPFLMLFRKN